jgi:hypothetical protein
MGRDGGNGGNVFEGVPEGPLPEELLTELLVAPGLRIARVVSTGQASPPGSWYDQDRAEWVLVLAGSAGCCSRARTGRGCSGRATTCSSLRVRATGSSGPTRGGRRCGWPCTTGEGDHARPCGRPRATAD